MKKLLLLLFLIPNLVNAQAPLGLYEIKDTIVSPLKSPSSPPVKILPYLTKIPKGIVIERQGIGLNCNFLQTFQVITDNDIEANGQVKDFIREEFKKYNFTSTDINVDLTLRPIVQDSRINSCYKDKTFKYAYGAAYVQVKWVLTSKKNNTVIFSTTTQGYHSNQGYLNASEKEANLFTMAMLMSARKLLANDDFVYLLTLNDSQKNQIPLPNTTKVNTNIADKEYEISNITQIQSNIFGKNKTEWSGGVFTIITDQGHGSGFAISKNLILTNNHVIAGEKNVIVKMAQDDGSLKAWDATVIRNSVKRDVALIKIKGELKKYFSINNNVTQGDDIYVMGSPLDVSHESTLTKGIISHSKRKYGDLYFIQSDANIYGGNSGGPMININGNVVGITVLGNMEAEGINLFIPIQDALESLNIKIE